jgi:Flp pilus assembly protein TadG
MRSPSRIRAATVRQSATPVGAPGTPSSARAILRRLRPTTRGQALAEFAIILPVFLLMLALAVDFGRLFFTYVQVHNAAREAAAFAATAPTDLTTITALANGEKSGQMQRGESTITVTATCANPAGLTIACTAASGGAGPGNTVTVNVRAPFQLLTPFVGSIVGSSVNMNVSATSTVRGYAAGTSGGGGAPGGCSLPTSSFSVVITGTRTIFADPSASRPNSGVCNISGYNWTWGDGTDDVGTATGVAHTFPGDGPYTVELEVTNQAGPNTSSQSVGFGAPTAPPCTKPVADFTWTKSGKTYTYRDSSSVADPVNCPITDWLWTFTDANGLHSNVQYPTAVTYGNNSSHPVTLVVTNSAGSTTVTKNT